MSDRPKTSEPSNLSLNNRRAALDLPLVPDGERTPREFVVRHTYTGRRFAEDRYVKVELEVTPNWWRDGFSNSAATRVVLRCAGVFPEAELRVSRTALVVVVQLQVGDTCEELCMRASELIAEFDVNGRYSGG